MFGLFDKKLPEKTIEKKKLSEDDIAKLLNTTPYALEKFEKAYHVASLGEKSDNFFDMNAKQAVKPPKSEPKDADIRLMVNRIVDELLAETRIYTYTDRDRRESVAELPKYPSDEVTKEEVMAMPEGVRPQLTGSLMTRDLDDTPSEAILYFLKDWIDTDNKMSYNMFRQGLDILDLDPIMYEIIGMNQNSMGHWLPQLVKANNAAEHEFSIPDTKIMTVPLSLLQLTRMEYMSLTETTKMIVDKFCEKAFELNPDKSYFIKTGTYSSKYDFRNCKVSGADEVRTIGEYLLFIHFQALQMASPLSKPCIYGASTTNEWVVRKYIPDAENCMTIYNGLPLHTEYRVFIDCDRDEVLGMANYWDRNVMEKRFAEKRNVNDVHDDITFKASVDKIEKRYEKNRDMVREKIEKLLPYLDLRGQWSLDVMQNGDDFYLIDMSVAERSAYYEQAVPEEKRHLITENWIPKIEERR